MQPRRLLFKFLVLGLLCHHLGCSNRPSEVAYVAGSVTLEGKPLANALVVFEPEGSGSPSMARTDTNGKYVLSYTPDIQGALIGKHRVRISTGSPGDPDTKLKATAEVVPKKYNTASELKREVVKGNNSIAIEL